MDLLEWLTKLLLVQLLSTFVHFFTTERKMLRRDIHAPSKGGIPHFTWFYPKISKMHRLVGYTLNFGSLDRFGTFKKSDPKIDLGTSKNAKIDPFFAKKTSKMAFYGKSHFGPQNDPKSTILDPQNDPKWPILTHFGPQKWPKIDDFGPQNGHFRDFPDFEQK